MIGIVSVVYLLVHMFSGVLFEKMTLFKFGFFSLVNYLAYSQISRSLENGLKIESYSWVVDIFVLNTVVEFGTSFTSYFWLLYLIIPGYLAWYLAKWCWGKASNIDYAPEKPEEDEKARKKREKKEKKEKERVVYKKFK